MKRYLQYLTAHLFRRRAKRDAKPGEAARVWAQTQSKFAALAKFCVSGEMTWWLERGTDEDVLISPHMGKLNKQH